MKENILVNFDKIIIDLSYKSIQTKVYLQNIQKQRIIFEIYKFIDLESMPEININFKF